MLLLVSLMPPIMILLFLAILISQFPALFGFKMELRMLNSLMYHPSRILLLSDDFALFEFLAPTSYSQPTYSLGSFSTIYLFYSLFINQLDLYYFKSSLAEELVIVHQQLCY